MGVRWKLSHHNKNLLAKFYIGNESGLGPITNSKISFKTKKSLKYLFTWSYYVVGRYEKWILSIEIENTLAALEMFV